MWDCIRQIRLFNPGEECEIYVVLAPYDGVVSPPPRDVDCTLVDARELPLSSSHLAFRERSTLDAEWRDGFWRHATERFFFLDELLAGRGLSDVLHVENDVMVYFDLRRRVNAIRALAGGAGIATTFQNDAMAVPGVVFVRGPEASGVLCEHLAEAAPNGKNDMDELAGLAEASDGFVARLPVVPEAYPVPLRSVHGMAAPPVARYARHQEWLGGVFDAAAIGQFTGGIDPRNGPAPRPFVNEDAVYRVDAMPLEWASDDHGRRVLFWGGVQVLTLHVHSKRLAQFSSLRRDAFAAVPGSAPS
jgi:hypothetical protein